MSLQALFTWLWIGWIALFGIIEFAALLLAKKLNDNNDETKYDGVTLSTFVWRLIKRNAIIFSIFTIFWIWLTVHFLAEV